MRSCAIIGGGGFSLDDGGICTSGGFIKPWGGGGIGTNLCTLRFGGGRPMLCGMCIPDLGNVKFVGPGEGGRVLYSPEVDGRLRSVMSGGNGRFLNDPKYIPCPL